MVDVSAETWNKAEISLIKIHENDDLDNFFYYWFVYATPKKRWGNKNLYDLIDKEIKGKYEVKNMSDLTKQQIRKYKIDTARLMKGS